MILFVRHFFAMFEKALDLQMIHEYIETGSYFGPVLIFLSCFT